MRPGRDLMPDCGGAAAIEFALLGPALIFLLLTVIQLGISYMQTSAVQSGAFLLARSIQDGAARPAGAASARAIVLNTNMLMQQSGDVVVSVTPLPGSVMGAMPPAPSADSFYAPGPGEVVLVRVIAKRTNLLPVRFFLPRFWDDLLGSTIDYSIVAWGPNA